MVLNHKSRIREKAQDLFMQYGMRRVSMDDIAAGVGCSKKTLYHHYVDKNDLVADVIELILHKNSTTCQHSKQNAENAVHEGLLVIDAVVEMMRRMNPVVLFDMQKYYPPAYKKFLKFKQDFLYKMIRDCIEWGIKDELFRADVNINLATRFRIECISLPFNQEFYSNVKMELADIQEQLFYMFLYGLSTPKGVKLIEKYRKQRAKN